MCTELVVGAHSVTKMQRAFVRFYCDSPGITQTEAAIQAGCSVKRAKTTASEWMRHPIVKAEIECQLSNKLQRVEGEIVTKPELTPANVIRELDAIREMCYSAGPGSWQVTNLVKIAELKGKCLQMFTEKTESPIGEPEEPVYKAVTIQFVDGDCLSPGAAQGIKPIDDSITTLSHEEWLAAHRRQEKEIQPIAEAKPAAPPPLPAPMQTCDVHGPYSLPKYGAPSICPSCQIEWTKYEAKLRNLLPGGWA